MQNTIKSLISMLSGAMLVKSLDDVERFLLVSNQDDSASVKAARSMGWQFPCLVYWDEENQPVQVPMGQLSSLINVLLQGVGGNIVAKAMVKAGWEHLHQRDKGGKPYVNHVMAVAHEVMKAGGSEELVSAALMHDVVEDTGTSLNDLQYVVGFPESVVMAVDSVSKREGESEEEYLKRVSLNPLGRIIKIADLRNNMDITRLKNRGDLTDKDLQRIKKYGSQYHFLVGGQIGV